jgi:HK97 family phage portal protein
MSIGIGMDGSVPVAPRLAENLSACYAAVQCIAETIGSLPLRTYRRDGDARSSAPDHPISRLFNREPNSLQTAPEFLEQMTAACLLYGNSYAEIVRDGRGAPVELIPLHPGMVSVLRIPSSRRVVYNISNPAGGTRRLVAEECLHLRDRSDDGVVGRSRLSRAREAFGTAVAVETHASSTFRNGATLSGVLSHPDQIGQEAADRLRVEFDNLHKGVGNAGRTAVLEEGLKWTSISTSPEQTELLASRRFGVEQISRIFRVPLPLLSDLSHANYANAVELNRMFAVHCIRPWCTKIERAIERSLLSEESRRTIEVEFDMDELTRGDLLVRWQSYRIMRETGGASANEIRAWEKLNPRTDPGGDEFLAPMNMASEQTGKPKPKQAAA